MVRKYLFAVVMLLLVGCAEPDFYDDKGEGHYYLKLRSNWLVINYWATWCAPCIREIPELNRINAESSDIKVFGVNFDGVKGEELSKQITRMKINFPVFAEDPRFKFGIPRPEVLPTTYIFSPDGNRIISLVGPQTAESILAEIK